MFDSGHPADDYDGRVDRNAQLLSPAGVELRVRYRIGLPSRHQRQLDLALSECLYWLLVPETDGYDNDIDDGFGALPGSQDLVALEYVLRQMGEGVGWMEPLMPVWFCTNDYDHRWLSCQRCMARFEAMSRSTNDRIAFLDQNPGFLVADGE